MSEAYFGLTTTASIRAQLGASEAEFSEQFAQDLELDSELQMDLLSWFPRFMELADDESGTEAVTLQQLQLKAYAKALCALKAVITAPLKFVQKKGDGNNTADRFQHKDSLANLESALQDKVAELKTSILALDTGYLPEQGTSDFQHLGASVSSPSTDIITR